MYQPYILALSPFFQTLIYLWLDAYHQKYDKTKFERELFVCNDGGTMGISWYEDKDEVENPKKDF